MNLSILIPSIPSRLDRLKLIIKKLEDLIGTLPVEVLAFTDNKKRSIGYKRDALVQIARGKYVAFIDDDDEVYDCYVKEMVNGTYSNCDVVSIRQHATIEKGNKFIVDFDINNPNEEARCINGIWQDVKRKPFHTCAWRSSLAKKHRFPDASYGEDWHWCKRVLGGVTSQFKIETPLLCYSWSQSVTEAEPVFPKD